MLTPIDIQKKIFSNAFRGYDTTQVDTFLDKIINDYEVLYKDNSSLQEEINICKNELKKVEDVKENIMNALMLVEKTTATIKSNTEVNAKAVVEEAEKKARLLIDEANNKAALIVCEAENKSAEIVSNARQKAAKIVSDAQRDTLASRESVEKVLDDARRQAAGKVAEANITASNIINSAETKITAAQSALSGLQQQVATIHNNVKTVLNAQMQSLDDLIKINDFSLSESASIMDVPSSTDRLDKNEYAFYDELN